MNVRQGSNKNDVKQYDTAGLRSEFLIEDCFSSGNFNFTYSHIDRIVVGGIIAIQAGTALDAGAELRSQYFLERREMGIINIGGSGSIVADGERFCLKKYDCLYLGWGTKDVSFYSDDDNNPAYFYINSCPAHKAFPKRLCKKENAVTVNLGSCAECNERTIHKYILPGNIESCQLVMGLTILKEGSVWNTMPVHTHERRMEVYLYFDVKDNNVVFHLMGDPQNTRHIVVQNRQAVLSPSYSIHSGVGTMNYTFIWGMCGENQDFDDMDAVKTQDIR